MVLNLTPAYMQMPNAMPVPMHVETTPKSATSGLLLTQSVLRVAARQKASTRIPAIPNSGSVAFMARSLSAASSVAVNHNVDTLDVVRFDIIWPNFISHAPNLRRVRRRK